MDINERLKQFEKRLLPRADSKTLLRYQQLREEINKREDYISELELTLLHFHYKHMRHRQMTQVLASCKRLNKQFKSFITIAKGN